MGLVEDLQRIFDGKMPEGAMLVRTTHGSSEVQVYGVNGRGMSLPVDRVDDFIAELEERCVDPQGNRYNGNDITPPYYNQKDDINNVEAVQISTPATGMYTVKVKGYNIPRGPQDFALVATYDNADVEPIPPVPLCQVGQQTC
ncbi:hypothetical protein HYS50_03085 [Candidatus Woesearchaeota archaeon]|nr:hypothetical protein [Candidatus Woesearchaeota archaeon]